MKAPGSNSHQRSPAQGRSTNLPAAHAALRPVAQHSAGKHFVALLHTGRNSKVDSAEPYTTGN